MLKKISILVLFVTITATINAQIKTPQPSPAAKIEQVVGLTNVTIEYSRPAMRGRIIFGDLVPYGKVWRTGANANTKITFGDNVIVDGQELKKGTYAIYTIPTESSWEVIFYSDANNWGTPQKWDDAKVAAKTTVKPEVIAAKIQSFTLGIDDIKTGSAVLGLLWDNIYVKVPFVVPTDKITSKSIEAVMNGPSGNDYFQAASYYHTEGKDLKQALAWMEKATDMENPRFWYLRRMSLIQADLGDKESAIATAKKSLKAAEKANNADYVKMNKESIEEWLQKPKTKPAPKSPRKKASGMVGNVSVSIDYGSPSVKGRTIWGGLEKYGKVWRAGANENTTVTFDKDVKIGTTDVPAGTYGFFIIPSEDEDWVVILNKKNDGWGAYSYNKDEDAVRITLPRKFVDENQETLEYKVTKKGIKFAWEKARLLIPVN